MGDTCSGTCLTLLVLGSAFGLVPPSSLVSVLIAHEVSEEARRVSGAERRGTTFEAVLEVLKGATVVDVSRRYLVGRQTVHEWLRRYATDGLKGLVDHSSKPLSCPHQIAPEVEARIVGLRRSEPLIGPDTIINRLRRGGVEPLPGRSSVYRCLIRHNLVRRSGSSTETVAPGCRISPKGSIPRTGVANRTHTPSLAFVANVTPLSTKEWWGGPATLMRRYGPVTDAPVTFDSGVASFQGPKRTTSVSSPTCTSELDWVIPNNAATRRIPGLNRNANVLVWCKAAGPSGEVYGWTARCWRLLSLSTETS